MAASSPRSSTPLHAHVQAMTATTDRSTEVGAASGSGSTRSYAARSLSSTWARVRVATVRTSCAIDSACSDGVLPSTLPFPLRKARCVDTVTASFCRSMSPAACARDLASARPFSASSVRPISASPRDSAICRRARHWSSPGTA